MEPELEIRRFMEVTGDTSSTPGWFWVSGPADLPQTSPFSVTPLMRAFTRGHFEEAQSLINSGADIHAKSPGKANVLMHLINAPEGNEKHRFIKLLINKGIDVNEKTEEGYTALHVAARTHQFESVKTLLEAGAGVDVKDNNWVTPLMTAADGTGSPENKLRTIKMLVDARADLNAPDKIGETPVLYAARHSAQGDTIEIIKLMKEKGADIHHKNNFGGDILMTAVQERYPYVHGERVKVVEYLIQQGVEVNGRNNDDSTPIMYALNYRNSDIDVKLVELLLSNGADVNIIGKNAWYTAFSKAANRIMTGKDTGLDLALFKNPSQYSLDRALLDAATYTAAASGESHKKRLAMFDWLLSKGANINSVGKNQFNILMAASYNLIDENFPFIDHLVEKSVNLNAHDWKGGNILHFMLSTTLDKGRVTKLALKFIDLGVNVNVRDESGNTPLMLAFRNKDFREVADALILNGADVNARDDQGKTVLFGAAAIGNDGVVEFLLKRKADLNIRDKNDFTALMLASDQGHYSTVRLLIKNGARFREDDYIHFDASSILEPKEGQKAKPGAKLHLKIKPEPNEKWLFVIYEFELLEQDIKLMEYKKDEGVFVADITVPNNPKENFYTVTFLIGVDKKNSKEGKFSREIIQQVKVLPDVRYIMMERKLPLQ